MGLHQKSKEVNPAIIRKYLRMRSLVHCLHANPTCRSLLSERMLAASSVTDAIEGRPSPSRGDEGQRWMRDDDEGRGLLSTLETLCESFLTLSRSLNTSSLASFDSHSPWIDIPVNHLPLSLIPFHRLSKPIYSG